MGCHMLLEHTQHNGGCPDKSIGKLATDGTGIDHIVVETLVVDVNAAGMLKVAKVEEYVFGNP